MAEVVHRRKGSEGLLLTHCIDVSRRTHFRSEEAAQWPSLFLVFLVAGENERWGASAASLGSGRARIELIEAN